MTVRILTGANTPVSMTAGMQWSVASNKRARRRCAGLFSDVVAPPMAEQTPA